MFIKFYQSKRHWGNSTRSKVTAYVLYRQQSSLLSCDLTFGDVKLFNMIDFVQPESNNALSIAPIPVLGSLTITQISVYPWLLCLIDCFFGTFCRFGPIRCMVCNSQLRLRDFSAFLALFLRPFNWSSSIVWLLRPSPCHYLFDIVDRCTFVGLS